MKNYINKIILIFILLILPFHGISQDSAKDDFQKAKELAYEGETEEALEILSDLLDKNNEYHDAAVLKARINMWNKNYTVAAEILQEVLKKAPNHRDAIETKIDLAIWSEDYQSAIELIDPILKSEPGNTDLLYKKAIAKYNLGFEDESADLLREVLSINPAFEDAAQLLDVIKDNNLNNKIELAYKGDYFEHTGPWHLYSVDYSRRINKLGNIILRANMAQRFNESAYQFEIDAYPVIQAGTYMYLNAGYSLSDKLFPKTRLGLEVFQALFFETELSGGFRIMNYTDNDLIIITASISKYFPKYYFSFRPYFSFSPEKPNAQSYFLTARRYFSGPQHHLTLMLGSGFSADEDLLLAGEIYDLAGYSFSLKYQQKISKNFLFKLGGGYKHYNNAIWGNPITIEAAIICNF